MKTTGLRLAPSTGDVLFVAILGVLVFIAPDHLLTDASTGWHVKTGEHVLEHRAFVRTDIFSYGRYGEPWFAWEWLADVALALSHRFAGLYGVVFFAAAVVAATFRRAFGAALARGGGYFGSLALVLLAFGASGMHALARPHLASWYLTLATYVVFDEYQRGARPPRSLVVAPVMMVAWVNLHGGFVLGLVLAGVMVLANAVVWASASAPSARDEAARRVKHFGAAALAMAAASCVSPYGLGLHRHVIEFLSTPHLMDTIEEYTSPDFHAFDGKCFAGLLLLGLVALAVSPRRPRVHEVGILAFAIASALFAARSVPTSSLLIAVIVAPHLAEAVEALAADEGLRWRGALEAVRARSALRRAANVGRRASPIVFMALVAFAALARSEGRAFGATLARAAFPAERFPLDGARAYLREHPEIDHVLSPDYYAGYVLYYFHPRVRVVIDDRMDFYGEATVREFQTLMFRRPGFREILDRWPADYVLMPGRSGLASSLRETSGWSVVYDDGQAVIFRRARAGAGGG